MNKFFSNSLWHLVPELVNALEGHALYNKVVSYNRNSTNKYSDPWMQYMRNGDFEAAWQISDKIFSSHTDLMNVNLPRHLQRVWNGTPIEGKRVLIRCYHGLGDTIQFIRYAPLVKTVATKVIVWAQPELIPLLGTMHGIDRLLPLHDGSPDAEYDVDVEVMELPYVFRTVLRTVPSEVPYLLVDAKPLTQDGPLSVGVIWQAGDWDQSRSIPFHLLMPFAKIPGVRWHVLQLNPEKAGWHKGFGIKSGNEDLLEAARTIRSLDLVISVDTMIAHLAGALGMPVWTLLQSEADWRWMEGRADTPWYPTMRLFRQSGSGEWEQVLRKVSTELERVISCRRCLTRLTSNP